MTQGRYITALPAGDSWKSLSCTVCPTMRGEVDRDDSIFRAGWGYGVAWYCVTHGSVEIRLKHPRDCLPSFEFTGAFC